MSFVVILLLVVAALFVMAYVTKRRFGVLGLALAAGAILSDLWVNSLTPVVANAGILLVKPPLESVVGAALILLPAVILLFSGPTYKKPRQRIIGSVAFAALAVALLLGPLGAALVIDGAGKPMYDLFMQYRVVVVTVCLSFAVFDVLVTRSPKH